MKKNTKNNITRRGNTKSQKMADLASRTIGSWWFIGFQTIFIIAWVTLNIYGFVMRWDPYPFIFLNLSLSVLSAYAAPVILMSQNREAERDRMRAINDLATDRRTERKIDLMQKHINRIERKIDGMK
jgi:uncharacterized membrane protein